MTRRSGLVARRADLHRRSPHPPQRSAGVPFLGLRQSLDAKGQRAPDQPYGVWVLRRTSPVSIRIGGSGPPAGGEGGDDRCVEGERGGAEPV